MALSDEIMEEYILPQANASSLRHKKKGKRTREASKQPKDPR
jgi:hypothetical protein